MNYGYIYFIISCSILLLSIININIGPIVSLAIGSDWKNLNCDLLSDEFDEVKKEETDMDDDTEKYIYKYPINLCKRRKGMYAMEYTAFIYDITFGFVCSSLGLIHLLGNKLELVQKTTLIGIISGILGFCLTFIYIVFNGLVFTNDYYELGQIDLFLSIGVYKRNGNGVFAELDDYGYYKCLDYDRPENVYALFAKYSNYLKKQYSYNKDLYLAYRNDPEVRECTADYYFSDCFYDEGYVFDIFTYEDNNGVTHQCTKLYLTPYGEDGLKNVSEKFVTTLIFSILICLCYVGLIVFGILLYYTPIF